MESLGQYLRDVREGLNLPLQEVYKRTNIDVTLLSRIEMVEDYQQRSKCNF